MRTALKHLYIKGIRMHLMTTCSDYPDVPTNPACPKQLGLHPYCATYSPRISARETVSFLEDSLEPSGFRLGFDLVLPWFPLDFACRGHPHCYI